jgi:hypothetical protein
LRRTCEALGLLYGKVYAQYCCFCYEVIWFVHLVEAIKATDQATIIPALFRFLPIDNDQLFAAMMRYLKVITVSNIWIRRSIQSHIFELLAIVLGEKFDEQLNFETNCSPANKKRLALAS